MLTIGDASLGADIVRFEITGASMAETELGISRVALHAVISPPSVINPSKSSLRSSPVFPLAPKRPVFPYPDQHSYVNPPTLRPYLSFIPQMTILGQWYTYLTSADSWYTSQLQNG